MTLEEFERMATAWGGDISRWPEGTRARAERLARTPEGEAILADVQRLDRLLTRAAPDVTPDRIDRAIRGVTMRLAAEKPRAALADLLPRWFIPAAGFACAIALGVLIGVAEPLLADGQPDDLRNILTAIFDAGASEHGWSIL